VPSTLLVLALVLAVLAIIPTRRLVLRGVSPVTTGSYFLLLWLLALSVVAAPGRPRFLLPVIVVLALLPFVTFREGLDRLLGRRPREAEAVRPPPRNVTPPDAGSEAPPR
jgi:hypothetical protein